MTTGPIIIIEDDEDDCYLYKEAIQEIQITNALRFFPNAALFLDYIMETEEKPLIILSDVNLPAMDGIKLKEIIQSNNYLREKGIPFVFISTNASKETIRKAYQLSIQGYFQKPGSMDEIKEMLRILFDYWGLSKHINNT